MKATTLLMSDDVKSGRFLSMSIVYVTSIPFDDLKRGHRLQGANGIPGTIQSTDVTRDENIGEEEERQIVNIIWSEDQAEVKSYSYDILSKVMIVGEPSLDLENIVLTSVEYDESSKTVEEDQFEPGTQFTIKGELLDVALHVDGYISVMSHDVVVVAPIGDNTADIDDDIYELIDTVIELDLVVLNDYTLEVRSVNLRC